MTVAAFLIELNQDVSVCRPVASYFRSMGHVQIDFFVTTRFRKRDATGVWYTEIQEIAQQLDANVIEVDSVLDVVRSLVGRAGVLVSASESELDAHAFNHKVFLAAPSSFLRVTLQHGLECLGFNHNAAHNRAYGHQVSMACDIAASWFPLEKLHSVKPDQKAKIMLVGPQLGLSHPPVFSRHRPWRSGPPDMHGLICENLHSVRFGAGARLQFVDVLTAFAEDLRIRGGTAELRPHPGGRYSEKNVITLPSNIRVNRLPLYKQTLEKFTFGISAPSSVLLDMVWAGIPTAVWTNGDEDIDIGIYEGLTVVSSIAEWLAFAEAATADPTPFLEQQRRYVASLQIPDDIPNLYNDLYNLVVRHSAVQNPNAGRLGAE